MPDRQRRRPLVRTVRTLAIAGAGGLALSLAGFPGGWLTGSLAAVALASLRGLDVQLPGPLKVVSYTVVGLVAGSAARPETLSRIWTWPLSFLVLAAMIAASVPLAMLYLRRIARWDPMTALLASFPGSLSTVVATAEDVGADVRAIVISQTLRVFLLLLIVPLALPWLGGAGAGAGSVSAGGPVHPGELMLVLGVAMVSGSLARRFGVPGGLVVGALFAVAALFASGLVSTAIPPSLFAAGLVILGANAGARFQPGDARLIASVIPHAIVVFAILVAAAITAATVVGTVLDIPAAQALMAYSPGALEAMVALAVITGVDTTFVAAHHAVRFFALSLIVPVLAARRRR